MRSCVQQYANFVNRDHIDEIFRIKQWILLKVTFNSWKKIFHYYNTILMKFLHAWLCSPHVRVHTDKHSFHNYLYNKKTWKTIFKCLVFFCVNQSSTDTTVLIRKKLRIKDKYQLTAIFGLREFHHLQLKVAFLREAIKVLDQDPLLRLDHDSLFGAAATHWAAVSC